MATGKLKKGTETKLGKPHGKAGKTESADDVPAKPASAATQGPTARSCPLVLDGEMAARDFTPAACMTCDEFDCTYCEAAQGSGALRSRLFGSGDAEDEAEDDGWGNDEPAFGTEEEEPEADEDLF